MARFLRWWQGGDEAKKRLKRWIKEGRITGRGDVSDLIGLLRWLRDYSQTVREAALSVGEFRMVREGGRVKRMTQFEVIFHSLPHAPFACARRAFLSD